MISTKITNIATDIIYPIGSIYISVNSVSPEILFGGTWEQLKDRFLLGAGDTYAVETTGGEATHTLTVDEMPSHSHNFYTVTKALSAGENFSRLTVSTTGQSTSDIIANTGGGVAHNNMPPYLAVYMWKRVA